MLSVSVRSLSTFETKQMANFHEIWYEPYTLQAASNLVLYLHNNFLHSVIT